MSEAERRSGRLRREAARSLDAPAGGLAVLLELLADVDALGCAPRRLAGWLHDAGVGPGDTVVELGCGKGAAAVAVARRCGCRVRGIDALGVFVERACELAARHGVSERCSFEVGDYRAVRAGRTGRTGRGHAWAWADAGLMIGVAPLEDSLAALRRVVRVGGLMLIDDAVAVRGAGAAFGVDRRGARALIERSGGAVLREHVMSAGEVRALEGPIQAKIRARARRLVSQRPGLRAIVRECLARQREAAALLTGPLRPALWLIERER